MTPLTYRTHDIICNMVTHRLLIVSYSRGEASVAERCARLLAELPQLVDYEFLYWNARTHAARRSLIASLLAPVGSAARDLRRYLCTESGLPADPDDDPEITILAWGKGCRVVESFVCHELDDDDRSLRCLRRIRQILLLSQTAALRNRSLMLLSLVAAVLATWPAEFDGQRFVATIAAGLSLMIGVLTSDRALEFLGVDPRRIDRGSLAERFERAVVHGAKRTPGTWPIPAVRARFPPVTDTHPEELHQISSMIIVPRAHRSIFAIESCDHITKIGPYKAPSPDPDIFPTRPDNVAQITHNVRFSSANPPSSDRTDPFWQIAYGTYRGFVTAAILPGDNLWSPEEESRYSGTRKAFVYRFAPEPGREYRSSVIVHGGYGAGSRDAHTHLRADAHYTRAHWILDLSDYLKAGWAIFRRPEAYFVAGEIPNARSARDKIQGPRCNCVASTRPFQEGRRLVVEEGHPGHFSWFVENVRNGGIVGMVFDVQAP